eukprot:CAMPEP_0119131854 /NCGR_PEP_ID=MMETSP1310-20130426/10734_1 /TAXON_ID=464262 /ORGANISM="Genus nov. species nov., Strain RCC2339" /LENGTH=329 /DNA_ID=CAMNT_0007122449 /DNA_START=21 /DNA_END=1010 /DNA_ORIENTATION=-
MEEVGIGGGGRGEGGVVETTHTDAVHDAQLDYYGKMLATCSSDRSISIFDVGQDGSAKKVVDLVGHEGPVWQIAWGHPKFGSVLASCSYDRTVKVWRREQEDARWVCHHTSRKMGLSVNSIAWAPHELGLTLAAASSDGYVMILYLTGETWVESAHFRAQSVGITSLTWRPVAPSFHSSHQSLGRSSLSRVLATGGCDNTIQIFSADEEGTWNLVSTLSRHEDWVRDVAWAPDVGLPSAPLASCGHDGAVYVWNEREADKKDKERERESDSYVPSLVHKFKEPVWRVSWSVTGTLLAVTSGENTVSLWKEDVSSDSPKWTCVSEIDSNK